MPRGSKPVEDTPRDRTVCVRFTKSAATGMDKGRGSMSRSDYIRAAVNEKNAREK